MPRFSKYAFQVTPAKAGAQAAACSVIPAQAGIHHTELHGSRIKCGMTGSCAILLALLLLAACGTSTSIHATIGADGDADSEAVLEDGDSEAASEAVDGDSDSEAMLEDGDSDAESAASDGDADSGEAASEESESEAPADGDADSQEAESEIDIDEVVIGDGCSDVGLGICIHQLVVGCTVDHVWVKVASCPDDGVHVCWKGECVDPDVTSDYPGCTTGDSYCLGSVIHGCTINHEWVTVADCATDGHVCYLGECIQN